METFHQTWRFIHIAAGFVGLAAFWLPIVSRKGGRFHKQAGFVFYACVWIVTVTAIISSGWAILSPDTFIGPSSERSDPAAYAELKATVRFFLGLLAALAMIALSSTVVARHAMLAHGGKRPLRSAPAMSLVFAAAAVSLAFAGYGVYLLVTASMTRGAIAVVVGVFLCSAARAEHKYLTNTSHVPFAWWYKHMEGMIGAGIAMHTAFFVFGSRQFFGNLLTGPWQIIPWIVPGVVGSVAIHVWTNHYRRQFADRREHLRADGTLVDPDTTVADNRATPSL